MFYFYFTFSVFVLDFCTGISSQTSSYVLPPWISENPGFKNSTLINSTETSLGSIDGKGPGTKGWVIFVNKKNGHGIEIELNKLCLESSSDFLMVTPWPLVTEFKQIRLFTGSFNQTLRLLIPNAKAFFVLYDASSRAVTQEMALKYRRYGNSLEVDPPSTESPVKKNTIFEVQLKGKPAKDYSDPWFLEKVREALKAIAGRYCVAHNISFNNSIPIQEMVRIHKVSFCPFEWPERDICASVKHSIFVSGVILLESNAIMDYELTAEHLRDMWREGYFPELEKLGISVFVLPATATTILWWVLITGLIIIGSLIATLVFWKPDKHVKSNSRKNSFVFEVKEKSKEKLGKLRRIPPFPNDSKKGKYSLEKQQEQSHGEVPLKSNMENSLKSDSSSDLPIKNYYGSLVFASNAAFEDEEGNQIKEFQA